MKHHEQIDCMRWKGMEMKGFWASSHLQPGFTTVSHNYPDNKKEALLKLQLNSPIDTHPHVEPPP